MLYNSLEHNKIGWAIKQKTLADARILLRSRKEIFLVARKITKKSHLFMVNDP
jgi:hypothetical protein